VAKLRNYNDELFAKEVVRNGGNVGEAIMELHPEITNPVSASAIGKAKIEHSREIRERISEQLDKQHLSLIEANKKLKQHLDAKKPFLTKDGVEYTEDWIAQSNALEKLYKLHGLLGNNVNVDARQVHLHSITTMSQEQIDRLEKILIDMDSLAGKLDLSKDIIKYQGGDGNKD
jgi:hypothetical protein